MNEESHVEASDCVSFPFALLGPGYHTVLTFLFTLGLFA